MANRLKRRSLAVSTPTHSPGAGVETDRDSPMVIPPDEVDEDAERRGRVRKRQSIGRFTRPATETPNAENVAGQSGAPGTPQTQGSLATGVGGYSAAQLAEHYANCMKLSAENKINSKNAFHLQLIDYMSEMMRNKKASEMDNFQAASCALDASAKIYAYRVDSVHSDTLKLAGGVGKTAQEQEEHDKAQGNAEGDANEIGDKKEKRRKKDKPTIEKNLGAINCSKFDLEFDVDPLFKKTSAQFDSGSGGGQFLTSLYIKDDGCELQLDSAAYISNGSPVNEEMSRCSVLELPEDFDSSMPNSNNFHDIGICPTFSTFTFTGWSLEQEERLMEDGKVELEKADTATSANNAYNHDEHAFDIDAPPILPEDDFEGGNGDPEDSFMGGVEMDVNDDNVAESDMVDKRENAENRQKKGLGLDLLNVDNIRDHLLTAPSEYSYFDTGRFGGWAGPRHWKFKPLQRHGGPSVIRSSAHAQQPDGDEEISAKRKKTALKHLDEVHDFLMLLETSLDQLMSNGSTALDRLEKNMSQPKRAIQLVKKTMENWEEERVVLPKDLHYKGKDFARLFVADYSVSSRSSAKETQSVDDTVDDYDFENENDISQFCPNAAEGQDAEYALDNPGEHGEFLSQTTVLPQIDEETGAIIGSIDPQNQSLVSAPKQVEKILIGYAKQAKKMDMRKLKVIEWNTLQHLSEKANQENKENKDDNGMEKETSDKEVEDSSKRMKNDSVVNFTELYQKLYDPKIRVPTRMLENLSVPLAFVALLHLCNENNLALENVPDFSNFKIQQG